MFKKFIIAESWEETKRKTSNVSERRSHAFVHIKAYPSCCLYSRTCTIGIIIGIEKSVRSAGGCKMVRM